jgi:ubiquinone/menaquinone biosynthesis C-methylase UbiE
MQTKQHWQNVYTTKATEQVSWFQPHAERSVKLIRDASIDKAASIIDVGGGASTLVDDLLKVGYRRLTVLDLSAAALIAAKNRLGDRASEVIWLEANVLDAPLPQQEYSVWHDRAVFHFLTTVEERQTYVQAVLRAVKPGGLIIMATFAEDGPTTCSGLPVMRYSAAQLYAEFGSAFQWLGHEQEIHVTPSGKEQKFIYCLCRKLAEHS